MNGVRVKGQIEPIACISIHIYTPRSISAAKKLVVTLHYFIISIKSLWRHNCIIIVSSLYHHCMDQSSERIIVGGPELSCGLRHMGWNWGKYLKLRIGRILNCMKIA